MPNCTSCGFPIPEGQGKSCSMCYGEPFYGKDGYYLEWLEWLEQEQRERERAWELEEELRAEYGN